MSRSHVLHPCLASIPSPPAQDKWIWHEHARHVFLPVRMDAQSGATITCKSSEGEVHISPLPLHVPFSAALSWAFGDTISPLSFLIQTLLLLLYKHTAQIFELDAAKEYGEVHASSMTPCENMVKMSELTEAAILHNLRLRYTENDIYVRFGD